MTLTPAEALELVSADAPAVVQRPPLTRLVQAFLKWLEVHNRPRTTVTSYADALGAFLSFARGSGLSHADQVSVLLLDAYFAWLHARGAKPTTLAHRRSVLISFWSWLEHEGFAERNIPAKTYPIKTGKRLPIYLEPHAIDGFLTKLGELTDLPGRRDHAMVATFFYLGLRVGELVALRVTDVDLRAGHVRITSGKGDRDRIVIVPPRLKPILGAYLGDLRPQLLAADRRAVVERPWVFVSSSRNRRPGAEPLTTRSVYWMINRRVRELLGRSLSPHKLRHTCASYLLYHGANLETIQRQLGHQDIRTTMIYLHTPQRRQEEEIARIFG